MGNPAEKLASREQKKKKKPQVKNCYAEDKLIQPFRTRAGRSPPPPRSLHRTLLSKPILTDRLTLGIRWENKKIKNWDGKYLKFKGSGEQFEQ